MKRNLIIFVVALPFIISFAFLIATKRPASATDLPLPNPNGWDKFVKAGEMVRGDVDRYGQMNGTELKSFTATNTEALLLAHAALTNECWVFRPYYESNEMDRFDALRSLAKVMAAQGRLAELQHDSAQAAQDYFDVMVYGVKAGRGGFILDAGIGSLIEMIGRTNLANLVVNLDSISCRAYVIKLQDLDDQRENWNDILERDQKAERREDGLNFANRFELWWDTHWERSKSLKDARDTLRKQQSQTRELIIELAARAYELDKGKPPTNITDLVPTYLKAVPQDPTTGKDMVHPP